MYFGGRSTSSQAGSSHILNLDTSNLQFSDYQMYAKAWTDSLHTGKMALVA